MKVITLTAPYGSLIALAQYRPDLGKHIETRGWGTSYRGPLAIHQALGLRPVGGKRGLLDLIEQEPFWSVLREAFAVQVGDERHYPGDAETIASEMPLGAIVAVVDVVAVCPTTALSDDGFFSGPRSIEEGSMVRLWKLTDQERAFGDYSAGRYAWLLADIRALPEPVAAKGALRLWNYDGELPL